MDFGLTMPSRRRFCRPTTACVIFATALVAGAGCGDDKPASERPVTALFVDVSKSSEAAREPGGFYEQGVLDTARETALAQGTLWASVASANTVANSTWEIAGKDFQPQLSGGDEVIQGNLEKQANDLEPQLVGLVSRPSSAGSDLLGALQMASRLFADYPDRPRALVLLTDGAINVGGVDLTNPPSDANEIKQVIDEAKAEGEIPDLTGGEGDPVRVWIGGLGHGLSREKAQAVIAFWEVLIPAAKGELVTSDSGSLRISEFP